MTFASASQFHVYLIPWVNVCLTWCLNSVLNVKVLAGAFIRGLLRDCDIYKLYSLLPGVWSDDEDAFEDASGEPRDKLGGTNMFPSPYSVWPKNILQFAEYAGSNIMNPRVTLNTSVWIFNPSIPILTRDTVTRNPSCPSTSWYLLVRSPVPSLA